MLEVTVKDKPKSKLDELQERLSKVKEKQVALENEIDHRDAQRRHEHDEGFQKLVKAIEEISHNMTEFDSRSRQMQNVMKDRIDAFYQGLKQVVIQDENLAETRRKTYEYLANPEKLRSTFGSESHVRHIPLMIEKP